MAKKPNALLAAMGRAVEAEPDPPEGGQGASAAPPAPERPAGRRSSQKHLGAYFDKGDPILERVAILRARLDMTNSELVEHALNELWKRHEAGRRFGE